MYTCWLITEKKITYYITKSFRISKFDKIIYIKMVLFSLKKLHTIFINCTAYAPLIYIEKLHKHYLSMHFSYGEIKIMDNIWGIKKKLFKFPPEKFLNYDTHTPPQIFFLTLIFWMYFSNLALWHLKFQIHVLKEVKKIISWKICNF